jgi:recombination protein RecT
MATSNVQSNTDLARRVRGVATRMTEGPPTITDLINRQRSEIARALPKHLDADRLARIAATVIKSNPRLLECTAESLLGSLMLSAQTGLEPGPLGHAYLVPRRNRRAGTMECQWQIGYKGIIELARRSGQLESIEARIVHEDDLFSFSYGLNPTLEHRPLFTPGAPVTAVFGLARFKGGGHYFLVMPTQQIEAARQRSTTPDAGPWISDYEAMAQKTVIRRMEPYLPLSPEVASTLTYDEAVVRTINVDPTTPLEQSVLDDDPDLGSPGSPVSQPAGEPDEGAPSVAAASETAPPPPDEPKAPPKPTQKMHRLMHALLAEVRDARGDDRFPVLTELLDRPVTTTSDLTFDEVSEVLRVLEKEQFDSTPHNEDPF